jgi:hypothetical protein
MNVIRLFNTDGAGEKASSGADADSSGPGGRRGGVPRRTALTNDGVVSGVIAV